MPNTNRTPPLTMTLPPVTPAVGDPPVGVWLDELPSDVCSKIATFVLGPRYSSSAINLSKVSEKQRLAVKNELTDVFNLWALGCSLLSWCCGPKLVENFATLLGSDASEIRTPGFALYTEHMEKCFKSLTLVKASIYDCPHYFYALTYARNIRSLSLKFSRREHVKSLVKRLSPLDLQEFSLTTVEPCCLHEELSNDPDNHPALAKWFPNVERLKLACYCCGGREHPKSFLWRVAEHFPRLKDVFVIEAVPDDAIDKLRKMDRVSARAAGAFQLIDKLPDRMVHVDTYDLYDNRLNGARTFHSNHLEQLVQCNRLEELRCILKPGCEYGLIRVMGSLRELELEFDVEERDDDHVRKVYEPEEGVLLEVIKAAPFLKRINFACVRIKRREAINMLIAVGDRLEEYEERLGRKCGCQEKIECIMESLLEEVRQLIEILQAAAMHNPNLRSFHLDGFISLADKDSVASELSKYDATIAVLERHAPLLNVMPFKYLRERLENKSQPNCKSAHPH